MNIEFVTPILPSRRAWIALAVILALAAVAGIAAFLLKERVSRLRAEIVERERAASMPAPPARPAPLPPYHQDALAAAKRAALPEAGALAELEAVEVIGIDITSIDTNAATSLVTVELAAGTDAALEEYLDQLNAGLDKPAWHIVRLASVGDSQRSAGSDRPNGHSVLIERAFPSSTLEAPH